MNDPNLCPKCGQNWDEHEFGVPAPYCPIASSDKPAAQPALAASACSAAALAQLVAAATALLTEVQQMRDGLKLKSHHTIAPTSDTLHWDGYTPSDPALDENAILADAWTKVIAPVEKALAAVKTPNDQDQPRPTAI